MLSCCMFNVSLLRPNVASLCLPVMISTKMNDLDLCIEVILGHVNHCVALVNEYLGIPG